MADEFLQAAIDEAQAGLKEGGIPIGSVLVHNGRIIGRGTTGACRKGAPCCTPRWTCENAGRQPATVYQESVLYTTLSPCPMCTGAILLYKIPTVIIGEHQTFMGEEELLRERGVTVADMADKTCIQMMRDFIRDNPALWNEDIGV
jgi:cytosine deaminase